MHGEARCTSGGNEHAKGFFPHMRHTGLNPSNPSNPSNLSNPSSHTRSPGNGKGVRPMTFWSQWRSQRMNGNRRQPDPPSQHEPGPNEWVVAHGRGTVPPAVVKTPVVLPPSVMMPPNVERGIVTQLSDGARQLVLEVLICPPNSENKKLKALIDTGAQINVIRRGLFPEQVLQDAKRPLMLTLADGQAFWGGDK